MNKLQFLETLRNGLKKEKIHDIDDILLDYEAHISEELKLGLFEENIIKSLGNIEDIINDYALYEHTHKNKRLFELITSSTLGLPSLILIYGLFILFFTSSIVSWSIGIYYLFQLSTFSFMPSLVFGINFLYSFMFIAFSFFLFSIGMKSFAFAKSMVKQYFVKKRIRIGTYELRHVYQKLFIYSLIATIILFIVTYVVSIIVSGSWGFWHYWQWFD